MQLHISSPCHTGKPYQSTQEVRTLVVIPDAPVYHFEELTIGCAQRGSGKKLTMPDILQ